MDPMRAAGRLPAGERVSSVAVRQATGKPRDVRLAGKGWPAGGEGARRRRERSVGGNFAFGGPGGR